MTTTTPLLPAGQARFLHTMIRVVDLERSIAFYTGPLGMELLRREDYPAGRFTLAFVGYDTDEAGAAIELTHNWDDTRYDHGTAFGHVALGVPDVEAACDRLDQAGVRILRKAGPMAISSPDRASPEIIAFVEDPDGYRIELVETRTIPAPAEKNHAPR